MHDYRSAGANQSSAAPGGTAAGVAKRKPASTFSGERSDRLLWAGTTSRPTGPQLTIPAYAHLATGRAEKQVGDLLPTFCGFTGRRGRSQAWPSASCGAGPSWTTLDPYFRVKTSPCLPRARLARTAAVAVVKRTVPDTSRTVQDLWVGEMLSGILESVWTVAVVNGSRDWRSPRREREGPSRARRPPERRPASAVPEALRGNRLGANPCQPWTFGTRP